MLLAVGTLLSELSRHAEIDIISDANIYADDDFSQRLQALVPSVRLRSPNPMGTHHVLTHHMEPLLGHYDIILASRFHAAILALRLGKPLVLIDPYRYAFEDETKLRMLSRLLRSSERYWAPLASVEKASDMVASVMAAMDDHEHCAVSYAGEHGRARQSFDDLAAFLEARMQRSAIRESTRVREFRCN